MKFVSLSGYSDRNVRKLIFQPCGRKQAKMAGKARIKRRRRTDENVALSKEGEVVRELAHTNGRLRSDFLYFDGVALGIFRQIFEQSQGDEIPYNRPANVLKRCVYTLGRQLIDLDKQPILAEYLQQASKTYNAPPASIATPDVEQNPFHWFYLLLLGENRLKKGSRRIVTRDQISKSSRQLVYAHKNDVPPEYVIGFILQIGGDPILDLYNKRSRYGWKTAKRADRNKPKPETSNTRSPETPS
ncbi:hypothetical protein O4H48_06020 [Rhodobacteraceae bacterium G21628-S1]|nr:hypothetical protein [Rhodobacteraceae bacterium G21628-S1]